MSDLLQELRDLLDAQSMRLGDFTLASGARSKYYFDCKATTQSPGGIRLVGQVLYRLLVRLRVEAVGGLAMGATYLSSAVSLVSALEGQPIYGFSVRENQKKHGLKKLVEESFFPGGERLLIPGRRVAVVDDVVTGGGSIRKAVEVVRERKCDIRAVIALVDRRAGGGELLRAEGLPYFSLFDADSNGTLIVNDLARVPCLAGVAVEGTVCSRSA